MLSNMIAGKLRVGFEARKSRPFMLPVSHGRQTSTKGKHLQDCVLHDTDVFRRGMGEHSVQELQNGRARARSLFFMHFCFKKHYASC